MNFKIYKETKVQACWPHFDCHNEHSMKWRLSTSVICAVFYSKVLSNSLLATTPSTTSKRAFTTPRRKGWTDCEAERFQLSWFTLTPAAFSGVALGERRWEVPQRHVASGLDWLAIHHPARAPSQHAYSHIQLFPYFPPNSISTRPFYMYRETHPKPFSRVFPHGPSWIIRPQPEVEVDMPCSLLLAHTGDASVVFINLWMKERTPYCYHMKKIPPRQSCHHVRLDSLYTLYHTIN